MNDLQSSLGCSHNDYGTSWPHKSRSHFSNGSKGKSHREDIHKQSRNVERKYIVIKLNIPKKVISLPIVPHIGIVLQHLIINNGAPEFEHICENDKNGGSQDPNNKIRCFNEQPDPNVIDIFFPKVNV